jgi:hypothetical protein
MYYWEVVETEGDVAWLEDVDYWVGYDFEGYILFPVAQCFILLPISH